MQTINTIADLRAALASERKQGQRISFVPTMGNLHAGHMALVEHASQVSDCIVASVFVNPMQFSQNEDIDAYPKTLEADQRLLEERGVKYLFAPTAREMYPQGVSTQVQIPVLSNLYCGASRPGHFVGVATICAKLFNIVQPNTAVFGEKDFQQLTIIRQMVRDLCIPVEIIGVQTGRADDGLALSSRNGYLSNEERQIAPALHRSLQDAADKIKSGERNFAKVEAAANQQLAKAGFKPDYFNVVNRETLDTASLNDKEIIILAAAQLGKARLIDNLFVDLQ
jgi:pantoate--beta-alanine ligase